MANVSRGAAGEVLAARFLRDKGWNILVANYRTRFGEIDIIADDGQYIVFVEVKTRGEHAWFTPAEAVTADKQRKLIRTAGQFLQKYPSDLQPRFDVIEVYLNKNTNKVIKINHIINAFGA